MRGSAVADHGLPASGRLHGRVRRHPVPPGSGDAAAQWSAFLSLEDIPLLPLALLPVASRAAAAVAVLTLRPMTTSQYSAIERGGAPVYAAAAVLAAACIVPAALWGSFAPMAAAVGYGLAAWHGYRQFDGMSGDISGFALVIGELCGAVVLTLGR